MKTTITLLLTVTSMVVGCGDDYDIDQFTLNATKLALHYDDVYPFSVKLGKTDITASTFKWSSSDEQVGTVDANGVFHAKRIGTTTISAANNTSAVTCNITIEPYETFLTEPMLSFGASVNDVKTFEQRKLSVDVSGSLLFSGENDLVNGVMYSFQDGKLTSCIVLFANTSELVERVKTFYSERYTYMGETDDLLYFEGENNLLVALSIKGTGSKNVVYRPKSIEQTKNIVSAIQKQLQLMEKVLSDQ